MIKDITVGQFYPGNSILHRSDPRVKLLLTFAFMVVVFIVNNYLGFLSTALFMILGIVLSGVPLKYTLKGLKPVIFIIVFAAAINMFTTPGTAAVRLWFIKVTYEGLDLSAKMALRLVLLIVGASLLMLTTTPILLTDGMEKLMTPLKKIRFPAHEIAMMMTIALRFIPTLLEETDKIMKAQAARGADFDTGNIIQRAKSFVPVLVPLFISAFRRADELATAMEARCYRGSEGRTRMKQLKFTGLDFRIMAVTLFFMACIIVLQYI